MILVADSGSTKTEWRLLNPINRSMQSFFTQGINPYFQDKEAVCNILLKELKIDSSLVSSIQAIYFYGAGCGSFAKNKELETSLLSVFPLAKVEVYSDLLAAAHAVCPNQKGLVAILGTGSNTCLFDGTSIVRNIDSLGYLLGDEGSGAHIGKTFIQALLNKELSVEVEHAFTNAFRIGKEEIFDAVYKQALPNRFLASFSKFVHSHLSEQCIQLIVKRCFEQFFDKHICKYDNFQKLKLNTVGSVGYAFQDIIREVAAQKGVKIGLVEKAPMDRLMEYHKRFFS